MTSSTEPAVVKESDLRDFLAKHLDLIDKKLELVKTEYRLTNKRGAAGSIDILAREPGGTLVVIELKRSDQTARQALHELEKYVGLLAEDSGIRADQLRCILLSTSWHELAVPFSRYVAHADFYVQGLMLTLGHNGYPVRCDPFVTVKLSTGLELCPIQLGMLFTESAERDNALAKSLEVLAELDIDDFIMLAVDYTGADNRVMYPHGLVIVFAKFSREMEEHINTLFPDDTEEEYDDDDWWHEQVAQTHLTSEIRSDEVIVVGPGRLTRSDGWFLATVEGAGKFSDTVIWPVARLLAIVEGDEGRYSVNYSNELSSANKPAWHRMKESVSALTSGAGNWGDVLARWLDECESRAAEVLISIYCPFDILIGLEALARDESDDSLLAQFAIAQRATDASTLLNGDVVWDGVVRDASFESILAPVVGDLMNYLTMRAGGETRSIENTLMSRLGLLYVASEVAISGAGVPGASLEVSIGQDAELVRTPSTDSGSRTLVDFLRSHPWFRESLLRSFDRTVLRR